MLLKIITFNVAHGRGTDNKVDIERQANLIKEYKPDIIFLQEVDMYTKRAGEMNQIREFAKKVGLYYCSMESNITPRGWILWWRNNKQISNIFFGKLFNAINRHKTWTKRNII